MRRGNLNNLKTNKILQNQGLKTINNWMQKKSECRKYRIRRKKGDKNQLVIITRITS